MPRKYFETLEGVGEYPLTWFLLGLLLIAAIAAVLGQVDIG